MKRYIAVLAISAAFGCAGATREPVSATTTTTAIIAAGVDATPQVKVEPKPIETFTDDQILAILSTFNTNELELTALVPDSIARSRRETFCVGPAKGSFDRARSKEPAQRAPRHETRDDRPHARHAGRDEEGGRQAPRAQRARLRRRVRHQPGRSPARLSRDDRSPARSERARPRDSRAPHVGPRRGRPPPARRRITQAFSRRPIIAASVATR